MISENGLGRPGAVFRQGLEEPGVLRGGWQGRASGRVWTAKPVLTFGPPVHSRPRDRRREGQQGGKFLAKA